jgi:Flp pilus assembly protein TadD
MTSRTSARAAAFALLCGALLAGCADTQVNTTRDYDAGSRLRVAAAAEASGRADVALSMYAAAAAAEPGRADLQASFVRALLRHGRAAQAEQQLRRALERHSDDPALLTQLGRLRLRSGVAQEALALFDRVIAGAPRNAEALDGRGVALDLLGRHAEAEQSHRAALALAPASIGTANNLAMSLLLAGRPAEAAAILEPLAQLPNAPARVSTNLAIARLASGDRDGAQQLLAGRDGNGELDAMMEALLAGTSAETAGNS